MTERRAIARHAATVLAGQLATMAFGVTDTLVAGRHSQEALAVLSVGSAVFISIFVAAQGVVQALLPAWAELHGAQRPEELGRSVRQALYLAALACAAGIAVLLAPGALLDATQVPAALQGVVREYLAVLALALPAAVLFRMYGTLSQALHAPHVVTVLQLGSLVVKVPLTVWLVHGGLGLPALGAVGCAWATAVANHAALFVALHLVRTDAKYRTCRIWQRMEPPHWPTLARFARIGVPAGLTIMVEVTSFTLMALLVARQGTVAAAAHQVAANLATVLFMVPLSIAIATSARISYWLGAGDPRLARTSLRTGFAIGACAAAGLSLLVFLLRGPIARGYSADEAVAAMAAGLLAWLAAFHLGDAVQGICVFVLRCYRVTVAPLAAYVLLLWGLGLGGGLTLAYRGIGPWPPLHTPAAFWIASSGALALLSFILLLILWRAVRRTSR